MDWRHTKAGVSIALVPIAVVVANVSGLTDYALTKTYTYQFGHPPRSVLIDRSRSYPTNSSPVNVSYLSGNTSAPGTVTLSWHSASSSSQYWIDASGTATYTLDSSNEIAFYKELLGCESLEKHSKDAVALTNNERRLLAACAALTTSADNKISGNAVHTTAVRLTDGAAQPATFSAAPPPTISSPVATTNPIVTVIMPPDNRPWYESPITNVAGLVAILLFIQGMARDYWNNKKKR
jgi:hypothetical protein